ncbi:MAG: DUF4037 domain-containing protein [Anaerolineae bacterium]|nr:DUF4037 domain-containing protein [Anaerolineae bacterium]
MDKSTSPHLELAQELAGLFSKFSTVEAVGLGGSLTGTTTDRDSDIDLYVYTNQVIPLQERVAIADRLGTSQRDMNLQFWDLGDEWYDATTGIEVDLIYWDPAWIAGQIDRVVVHHQASVGYSTCFWHTIHTTQVLYDKVDWLKGLKEKCKVPYPESLRRAIVAKNHPILRNVIPAYAHQIEKAMKRNDAVSVNHRVAGLIASYFDALFALNRVLHPGEKRLVQKAYKHCEKVPPKMGEQVENVVKAAQPGNTSLLTYVEDLIDGLDALLFQEGFDPQTSLPLEE